MYQKCTQVNEDCYTTSFKTIACLNVEDYIFTVNKVWSKNERKVMNFIDLFTQERKYETQEDINISNERQKVSKLMCLLYIWWCLMFIEYFCNFLKD